MGGMAIMLAFSSGKFMDAVASAHDDESYYMRTVGSFFHFILFQSLALLFALTVSAFPFPLLSAVGFWTFAYSLMTALATAAQLLSTARILNAAEGSSGPTGPASSVSTSEHEGPLEGNGNRSE